MPDVVVARPEQMLRQELYRLVVEPILPAISKRFPDVQPRILPPRLKRWSDTVAPRVESRLPDTVA